MGGTPVLEAEGRLTLAPALLADAGAGSHVDSPQTAQLQWSVTPIGQRLAILRRMRRLAAGRAEALAAAISPELQRTPADTLVAEALPLLAAIRFLEREAPAILGTRRLGTKWRPVWLGRVTSEIERVPFGRVLVIGVSNYPLFLPGVQVLQALAAGNAVTWKPGRGGAAVATMVASLLEEAGLPQGLLVVTDESVRAAERAIDADGTAAVSKIFFTGSAAAGRAVLRRAAERLVPCVVELSGADAAIVLPGADPALAARAIAFGVRLNGSATCMAPRRLLLVDASPEQRQLLLTALTRELGAIGAVRLPDSQRTLALALLQEARAQGATVSGGEIQPDGGFLPAMVLNGSHTMRVAQTDLFAPVLTLLEVKGEVGVLAAQAACPLALTASIFCGQSEKRRAVELARRLEVGHVSINDVIVPTADPRVPFTGRKSSGFGATRGAEGLLEMTAPRVVAVRRGHGARRYERTAAAHVGLFAGLARLLYGGTIADRTAGLKQLMNAGRTVAQAAGDRKSGEA